MVILVKVVAVLVVYFVQIFNAILVEIVLHVLYTCIFVGLVSINFFIVLGGLSEIAEIIVGEAIVKLIVVVLMIVMVKMKLI